MDRLQLVSLLAAGTLLLVVLELVRRRRLLERYALLWLFAAVVMLGLAAWAPGLERLAEALGIIDAPNALFFVALGFIVVLLLHFSAAVSRLSDQTKVLAQRLAIMEQQMREPRADATAAGPEAEEAVDEDRVRAVAGASERS